MSIEGKFKTSISDEILNEITAVLNREKFKLNKAHIDGIISEIETITYKIYPDENINNVCRDYKDHIILECAVKANADYIITGDQDLLVLDPFQQIRIISPADFLKL